MRPIRAARPEDRRGRRARRSCMLPLAADLRLRLHDRGEELSVAAARADARSGSPSPGTGRTSGRRSALSCRSRRSRRLIALVLGTLCAAAVSRHRSSSAARRSRCWSSCRSRCPASSPASRCAPPSRLMRHPVLVLDDRPGPRDLLHRGRLQQCGRAFPPRLRRRWSRRRWISAPTASRRSATSILPNIGTALLAGGMLAFALCFDEVIVTTFTAGQQQTLPIWMLEELDPPAPAPGDQRRRHGRGRW